MNSSREAIYGAVFAKIVATLQPLGFKTLSRRVRMWTEVDPADQPAAFMNQVRETAIDRDGPRGIPNKWHILIDVPIYVFGGPGAEDLSAPLLNNALDALEQVFPPGGPVVQTLGLRGVSEIRVFGDIEIGQGNISGQGIAVVPIRIVAT